MDAGAQFPSKQKSAGPLLCSVFLIGILKKIPLHADKYVPGIHRNVF